MITVAAGAHTPADNELGILPLECVPKVAQHIHGGTVDFVEILFVVTDFCPPIPAGPPGGAFQDEIGPIFKGQVDVGPVVAFQGVETLLVFEKVESGKFRQVKSVIEHQRRFQPAVGQEGFTGELRQVISIFAHDVSPLCLWFCG